jgi:hypothetical protein
VEIANALRLVGIQSVSHEGLRQQDVDVTLIFVSQGYSVLDCVLALVGHIHLQ